MAHAGAAEGHRPCFLPPPDFTQQLIPLNSTLGSTIVALLPLALLLVLLAVVRVTAWLAVIIGAIVTIIMAITIWGAPVGPTFGAWAIGAATGIWSIDWIVFWGVVIYNVLVETGAFASFRRWLVAQPVRLGGPDRGDPRLDAGPARLPHPDRHLLLLRAAGRDAAVSPRAGAGARQVRRAV